MLEKLVIKFIKLEKALVAQQQEIEFSREDCPELKKRHVRFRPDGIAFANNVIWISDPNNSSVAIREFDSNYKRDVCLTKILGWISDELFSIPNVNEGLKIGEMCEVSNDGLSWTQRRLIAILPEKYNCRYIIESIVDENTHTSFTLARPIGQGGDLSVNGDTYTWERR